MAKKLSNKNQALLALGAAAAIGVFLYTRKKPATAGIGAVKWRNYDAANLNKQLWKAREDIEKVYFAILDDESLTYKQRRNILDDLDKVKFHLAYARDKIEEIKPLPTWAEYDSKNNK